ncbi:SPOSA6832_04551, partial [Sporobolomyces salmonicolor]
MDTSPLPPASLFASFHSRPIASPHSCREAFHHNRTGEILSLCIVVGLVLSYLPQHFRIIRHRNSEGFSPLFLLLGATSSASSLGNIVTLQWGQVACCHYLSAGQCFESVLGIAQVFVQWFCFNLIFVLYLLYYPLSAKYVRSVPISVAALPSSHRRPQRFLRGLVPSFMRTTTPRGLIRPEQAGGAPSSSTASHLVLPGQDDGGDSDSDSSSVRTGLIILSPSYRHALSYFFLTLLHLVLTFLTTSILLVTLPGATEPGRGEDGGGGRGGGGGGREHPSERAVRVWATTQGLVSVGLGCAQYAPQLVLTARRKLVGSLSVPMMLLQTPGSFLFVYTLAIRPSVNFTAWGTYFVTGVLQGTLLVLCLVFKRRQAKLGIDDWGREVTPKGATLLPGRQGEEDRAGERTRLLG